MAENNPGSSPDPQPGSQSAPSSDISGQIAYDPNQMVSIRNSTPAPGLYGEGDIVSEINTCQETLRQWGLRALNTITSSNSEVDVSGIRESRRINDRIETTNTAEEARVPPPEAVTPPLQSDDAPSAEMGMPTGFEDSFREVVEQTTRMVRDILSDLDMLITVNGKEFHIRCGRPGTTSQEPPPEPAGDPTSAEDDVIVDGPRVQMDIKGPRRTIAAENMVHLLTEAGGQPISLLAAGGIGQPTQGGSDGNTLLMSSRTEVEQIGVINTNAGFTVSFNVQVLNIQVS